MAAAKSYWNESSKNNSGLAPVTEGRETEKISPNIFRRQLMQNLHRIPKHISHSYSTAHPDLSKHGQEVIPMSLRRFSSDVDIETAMKQPLKVQDSLAVSYQQHSPYQSSLNDAASSHNSEHLSTTSEDFSSNNARKNASSLLVIDGKELNYVHDVTAQDNLLRNGGLGIQVRENGKGEISEEFGDLVNWLNSNPANEEVYTPLSEDCRLFLSQLFLPGSSYQCCAYLTREQEFYFVMMGFVPLFLLLCFFTCSSHLSEPSSNLLTMPKIGLCYLLSAYVAMMTTYVYRGNNLPVKSFGIPALVFMSILSMVTAALIVGEFSVPEAVWYVLLVLIGICAGVCMSVFEIMSSLFPGGRSVCMVNWGRGFAFLLPALAELGFVLFCHFKPTGDWSFASRIKSCVLFVLAALFIMCSIQGLLVLTRSGIFKLFRGKRIFFNSNVTGDQSEEKTIFWSDIWGYLILQFATAGITMYILVGAYGISTATKDALPTPVFYNAFWERFHAPMIIMLFLCGGFIGVCVTACSRFKTVVDSNCAMMSLFIPSLLRTGLIAIFLVYMHKPFLTSHGVFSMILYFFTAFSDVIIQHSLASYCQKLVGFLPKKLVCCNVGMICLMSQLLGATTGAVLSFVSLQALQ